MRRVVTLAVCAAVALSGCAGYKARKAQEEAFQQKEVNLRGYARTNLPLMKNGTMKRSDYWKGLYTVAETPPVRTSDMIVAKGANDMIAAAEQLESGQITQSAYDQIGRNVQIGVDQEFESAKERYEAAAAQQRQVNQRLMMQYYLNTRPVTTTCYANTCTTR